MRGDADTVAVEQALRSAVWATESPEVLASLAVFAGWMSEAQEHLGELRAALDFIVTDRFGEGKCIFLPNGNCVGVKCPCST